MLTKVSSQNLMNLWNVLPSRELMKVLLNAVEGSLDVLFCVGLLCFLMGEAFKKIP